VSEPGPDVVRIPTQEIEAVRLEAATRLDEQPVAPPVAQSVMLNDSLSLSPELLADGAMTLSAEEVEAIQANNRKVWVVFGGVVGAALALIGVVVMLATRSPEVPAVPKVPKVMVSAPVSAGAQVKVAKAPAELEELTPLSKIKAAPRRRGRTGRAGRDAAGRDASGRPSDRESRARPFSGRCPGPGRGEVCGG
jgi:hypothetical protein